MINKTFTNTQFCLRATHLLAFCWWAVCSFGRPCSFPNTAEPPLIMNTATSSPISMVTTVPGTCPTFSGAPANESITNSICVSGYTPSGGVITAPGGTPCPAGSVLQYQVNGGSWTTNLPEYDQDGPVQSIKTRCSSSTNDMINSVESVAVSTAPGACVPIASSSISVTETSGATNNDGIICSGANVVLSANATGELDQNQESFPTCLANVTQADLAQSFKPAANVICGAGVYLRNNYASTLTIWLYTNLPNAGGVLLAQGTASAPGAGWLVVSWPSVSVTPGTTYYLVFSVDSNISQCLGGNTSNPYPDGQTYANSGYQSYPGLDFTFRTYACLTSANYLWSTTETTAQITASPAGTTTYMVSVTNSTGCISTASTTINVTPTLNAVATPTAQTICNNSDTNIALGSNVPGTSFSWIVHSTTGTVSGQSGGNGTMIGQTLANSGATAATVTYRITPTAPDPDICVGPTTDVTVMVAPSPAITCPGPMFVNSSTDGTGNCSGAAIWTHPTIAAGPCGPIVLTMAIDGGAPVTVTPGSPASEVLSVGQHTMTYVVSDGKMPPNTATCSFTVTVIDDESPSITCLPPRTYSCNESTAPVQLILLDEDFSDNSAGWTLGNEWQIGPAVGGCGDPDTDHSPSSDNGIAGVVIGGCAGTASHDYYYLTSPVIDASYAGNDLTLSYRRNLWSDYTPYMKNIVQVFDGVAWQTIWETFGSPEIRDNSWVLQSFNIAAYKNPMLQVRFGFNVGSLGAFNRGSWNLDDVVLTASEIAFASDNCGDSNLTISYSDTPGGPCQGCTLINRIWTATDASNNSNECIQVLTIVDDELPTITCPGPQTLALGANCTATLPDYTSLATTGDNCGVQGVTQSPVAGTPVSGVGNMTVTLTVTDVNNLTNTCTFTVNKAGSAPTMIITQETSGIINNDGLSCAGDEVTLTGISPRIDQQQANIPNCVAVFLNVDLAQSFIPQSNTICGAGIYLSSGFGSGTITIQLYSNLPNAGGVLLAQGSALGSESWVDVYWPPVNITPGATYYLVLSGTNDIQCARGSISNPYPGGQAYANPGYQPLSNQDYAFRTYSCGSNSYLWSTTETTQSITVSPNTTSPYTLTLTDENGCMGTAIQTITVNDLPTAGISAAISPICTGENAVFTLSGTPNAVVTYTINGGSSETAAINGSGQATVTVNNTTANQTLTLVSVINTTTNCSQSPGGSATIAVIPPPSVTCPATQTLTLGGNCSAVLPNYTGLATAADGCGMLSVTQWPAAGTTVSGAGNMTVTLTVTDAYNQTNTCTFTVTKVDQTPPTLVCKNTTVFVGNAGAYTLQPADVFDATASSDNCSGELSVINISPATVNCTQVGQTIPVTVTVQDAAGNSAACIAQITVQEGTTLPAGWSSDNVGNTNGTAGYKACSSNGSFTVTATGFSTSAADVLHVAFRQLCGNGEIIAKVMNVSGGGWAGIVLRESLAPGSKKVALKTQFSTNIRREIRTVTNGAASILNLFRPQHVWFRLVRDGSNFVGYTSTDGTNWSFAFSATVSMTGCIYAGVFAESINAGTTTTASFSNVSILGGQTNLTTNPLGGVGEGDLDEILPAMEVNVFPNPTSGVVNVTLTQYLGRAVRLEVYSLEGKLLQFIETDEVQTVIEPMNLTNYQNGMYLIKVKSDGLPDVTRRVVLTQ